jgi:hypothetical protein
MTRTRNYARTSVVALAALLTVGAVPGAALAQTSREEAAKRQKTKNDWRNLAILGGAATAFGLLKGNNTIALIGAAGGLYSLNRYEQDRKSQSKTDRERASFYSRPYYYKDGQRYERRTVTRNGERFYQYVRK